MRLPSTAVLLWVLLVLAGRPVWAQTEPRTPEAEYVDAFSLYADQLYDQAIQAFQAFRDEHPDHINTAEALYYQAESALALGREEEAVRLFRTFEERYPVHPLALQATLALGKYFFESEQYDLAIRTLDQLLERNPPQDVGAKALYLMGEAALEAGRTEEGLAYFQRAADEYRSTSTAPVALFTRAYTEVQLGRLDDAARTFEVLAARYPESRYARDIGLALAEVYYELRDYQRVISEIQRRRPDLQGETLERAEFLLAESYNHLRDSENAIIHYRRFTEDNPGSPYYRPALYGLAWNYYLEEAYEWAADYFARAREGHNDEIARKATYYEAAARRLHNEPQIAIELWEEYLERWPEGELVDHALHELGLTQYDLRMWKEANETFARLIKQHPDSETIGDALFRRGNTFIALGQFEEAQRLFDRAIEMDAAPADLKEDMAFQKAWLLYLTEKYQQAAPAFASLAERTSGDRKAESVFWAAESFYQAGNLGEASRLFRTYLNDFRGGKHTDAATYALGWVNFKQRDYGEAVTYFQRFLDQYRAPDEQVPYRTDAMLRLADSYYALKRYAEAVRTYQQVAEQGGEYALYQVGQAFANAGRNDDAIRTFRRLLTEYPGGDWAEEAQYQIGQLTFLNQNYDEAIAEYQKLIEQWPRHPLAARAQYGIGDALFNADRHEDAIKAYQVVLDRYPSSPFAADAASSIQYALINIGQANRANRILEDYARENPDSPVVDQLRFSQAEAKYQSGRTQEALADLKEFVSTSKDPKSLAEAYYYLGAIQSDARQYNEAVAYLRRVIQDFPESPRRADAARRLGELYMAIDRASSALDAYQTMEAASAGNPRLIAEARYGQSSALIALGRASEAERLLQDVLRSDANSPNAAPALLGLARLYEQQNRANDAIPLYRQIVDRTRDETGAEALYRLGALLLARGDARAAVEELSRMPVLYPDFPVWLAQGYLEQARAFRAMDRPGDAARAYERIIDEYPNTEYAQIATREMADL